jgi:hypothetical protein
MDERTRLDLRIRFLRLAVLLNFIVLLIAAMPLAFFFLRGELSLTVTAGCAVALIPTSLYFLSSYRSTKSFLEEH